MDRQPFAMMLKSILVLSVAAAVLGKPGRITGGTPAAIGEIPFQLSLQDRDGQHFCGAFIISPTAALTAASCIEGLNAGQGRIIAGSVTLGQVGTFHRADVVLAHPDFALVNGVPTNDIAIITVNPAFPANAATGQAFLPVQGFETPAGLASSVSGWGTTSFGGPLSNDLLRADVPVIDKAECAALYADLTGLPVNQICAGLVEGGADACDRDVGGPLFESGVVYGIFSWGGRCGEPGRPGVYTEVAAYRDWIDANSV